VHVNNQVSIGVGKSELHRAVSLRQHGFLVESLSFICRVYKTSNNSEQTVGQDSKTTWDALIEKELKKIFIWLKNNDIQ